MGAGLRSIGRVVRNLADNLADLRIVEIPWIGLSWLGRLIARIFTANRWDLSDAAAAGLGLVFLVLLIIVGVGVFNWLRETEQAPPPSVNPDPKARPSPTEKPWWE